MFSVCFTGHRPDKFNGYNMPPPQHVLDWLEKQIDKLINIKSDIRFISGAAQGLDQWAAEIVLKKKEEYKEKNVQLLMAIPYYDFGNNWPYQARESLKELNEKADEVIYVFKGIYADGGARLLQLRNEWMVDRSKLVLAIWDGSLGGTRNCVVYAQQEKVDVIRYDYRNEQTIKLRYSK